MLIDGDPTFLGPVTTSWHGTQPGQPGNRLWRNRFGSNTYTSNPTFAEGISWRESIGMPPTNKSITEQTTSATGGCLYYGPTYIHLDGTRMRVSSPWSTGTPEGGTPTISACKGQDVADTGWIERPDNGVIYVGNATHQHINPCDRDSHPLGLPNPGDRSNYGCTDGDVFVWGEVDGQVTIAAENNITVIADLTYAGGYEDSNDLVGLIADNYVQVWHPYDQHGNNLPHTGNSLRPYLGHGEPNRPSANEEVWENPTIHAAILSLNHSFRVQNHDKGQPLDTLSVRGAIAQKFRGPVGMSYSNGAKASGYDKDYRYDYRLQYLSPPYFIEPVESQWRQRAWAEVTPEREQLPPLP